jgi:hypothetical protein
VNDSSQEQTFTITLDDNYTSSTTSDTITISSWDSVSMASIPSLTSSDIVTLTGSGSSTFSYTSPITINTIDTIDLTGLESFNTFNDWFKEEFDGRFPDYDRVMEMCKEYPGLEIAYRKFREVYEMVKEDYDGKQRERRNNQ